MVVVLYVWYVPYMFGLKKVSKNLLTHSQIVRGNLRNLVPVPGSLENPD
jgi:hypothetical protein